MPNSNKQTPNTVTSVYSSNTVSGFLLPKILNCNHAISLRLMQQRDFDIYHNLYSNTQVCQYIGGVWANEKIKRTFELSIKHNQTHKRFTWVIYNKLTNQDVGLAACIRQHAAIDKAQDLTVGLKKSINKEVELGILLLPAFIGQGIGEPVLNTITAYAFNHLNIQQVNLCCGQQNINAQNLNKKLFPKFSHNDTQSEWQLTKQSYLQQVLG